MSVYRRLIPFVRPHSGRMIGAIAGNVVAAVIDAFSLSLLIPFLNTLFDQPPIPLKAGGLAGLLRATVGSLLDPADKMGSLRNVILIVLVLVITKNVIVWLAGQLGASLQEFVTRDLRNALYAHLEQLPLTYFTRTKAGQILSRVITDTAETRLVIRKVPETCTRLT